MHIVWSGAGCMSCTLALWQPGKARLLCQALSSSRLLLYTQDTTADNENCGACGTKCPTGQYCSAGKCVCPGSLIFCDGACKVRQSPCLHGMGPSQCSAGFVEGTLLVLWEQPASTQCTTDEAANPADVGVGSRQETLPQHFLSSILAGC